jgi:hypothetical protein
MCEQTTTFRQENAIYQADITGQQFDLFHLHEAQVLRLVLTVQVLGPWEDAPAKAGIKQCQPQERVVVLFFPRNPTLLEQTLCDLAQMGFQGDDIRLLHPDHLTSYSLVGKRVPVRVRRIAGREVCRLAYSRGRVLTLPGLSRFAETVKVRITALRGSTPTGANNHYSSST